MQPAVLLGQRHAGGQLRLVDRVLVAGQPDEPGGQVGVEAAEVLARAPPGCRWPGRWSRRPPAAARDRAGPARAAPRRCRPSSSGRRRGTSCSRRTAASAGPPSAALKSYAAPRGVGEGERRPPVGLGQVEARVACRPAPRPAAGRRRSGRARSRPRRCRAAAARQRQPGGQQQGRQAPGAGGCGRRSSRGHGTSRARHAEDHAGDRRPAARGSRRRAPRPPARPRPSHRLVRRRPPSRGAAAGSPRPPSAASDSTGRRVLGLGLPVDASARSRPTRYRRCSSAPSGRRARRRPGTARPTARTPGTPPARCPPPAAAELDDRHVASVISLPSSSVPAGPAGPRRRSPSSPDRLRRAATPAAASSGIWIRIATVLAVSLSLGTRNVSFP